MGKIRRVRLQRPGEREAGIVRDELTVLLGQRQPEGQAPVRKERGTETSKKKR